jgi:hypothetical protein
MEQSVRVSSKSKLRNRKRKSETAQTLIITKAFYISANNILLSFSDGKQKLVNFQPLFSKYATGYYAKYSSKINFKKFKVRDGNISWGENEEIIFPVSFLYNSVHAVNQKEEILYVL